MRKKLWFCVAVAMVVALSAGPGWASMIDVNLGAGWYASQPTGVTVTPVDTTAEYVEVSIRKDIRQAPIDGEFDYTIIPFSRTAGSPPKLIVDFETVNNLTGTTWTGFQIALGTYGAGFDNSTGTPSGSPFDDVNFSQYYGYDDRNLPTQIDFAGGFVPNGTTFSPGQMVILLSDNVMTFAFKELPQVPEPLSCLLLAIGVLLVRRRV